MLVLSHGVLFSSFMAFQILTWLLRIQFASRCIVCLRNQFPDEELPKEVAYQVVADILEIDGRPRLNLASFVTTWMEPEADKLMQAAMNKNAIDLAQYPACSHIQVGAS